jgi:putative ABC transport system substrate-binding protein
MARWAVQLSGAGAVLGRRAFLSTLTGGLLAAPIAVGAQETGKVYRIGLLDHSAPDPTRLGWWQSFKSGLRDLGYVEGQNVVFEPRWAREDASRLPTLTAELLRVNVHVIVTAGTATTAAAGQVTRTTPIVQASGSDLADLGVVASLARPGGNVTGVTSQASELSGKRIELLKELIPHVSRVAIMWDRENPGSASGLRDTRGPATSIGVTLRDVGVRAPRDFEAAFSAIAKERVAAVIVLPSAAFFPERRRIADLAAARRLPTVVGAREYAEAGGLMSYGTDFPDLFRRAARYVDKILKGAKPADLPIEQPTKFELVINLKTAKALGLTIPPSLLLRADQVIE